MKESVQIIMGATAFIAQIRHDLAPRSCGYLKQLLPYTGIILHARWSGEACWSPLRSWLPSGVDIPSENETSDPKPGHILLYAGKLSEPELYFPYGINAFASKSGPLSGNPVLSIEKHLPELEHLGREILLHGALDIRIQLGDQ